MKLSNNKVINKYFLYTLLGVCVFSSLTLTGMFVAGNTNVFEWDSFARFVIVLVSLAITCGVIAFKETN